MSESSSKIIRTKINWSKSKQTKYWPFSRMKTPLVDKDEGKVKSILEKRKENMEDRRPAYKIWKPRKKKEGTKHGKINLYPSKYKSDLHKESGSVTETKRTPNKASFSRPKTQSKFFISSISSVCIPDLFLWIKTQSFIVPGIKKDGSEIQRSSSKKNDVKIFSHNLYNNRRARDVK